MLVCCPYYFASQVETNLLHVNACNAGLPSHTSSSISELKVVHRRNIAACFDDEVCRWLMKWSCRRRAACAVRCVLRAWDNLWLIWLSWMVKRLSLCRRLCQFFFRSSRFPLRLKAFAVFFYPSSMDPRACRRLCRYFFRSSRFDLCSGALVIWCNSVPKRRRVRRRLCRFCSKILKVFATVQSLCYFLIT